MSEYGYPLHPYFTEMPSIGKEVTRPLKKNIEQIKEQEALVAKEVERVKNNGKATEVMNEKGE
ncbi:MAG: glutaconyl-CoA decarboxylase subunit alpha, partial [Anaerovorax sp.]